MREVMELRTGFPFETEIELAGGAQGRLKLEFSSEAALVLEAVAPVTTPGDRAIARLDTWFRLPDRTKVTLYVERRESGGLIFTDRALVDQYLRTVVGVERPGLTAAVSRVEIVEEGVDLLAQVVRFALRLVDASEWVYSRSVRSGLSARKENQAV